MSRIQDILSKAERDGNARRTRGLADDRRDGAARRRRRETPRRSHEPTPPPGRHAWPPAGATATAHRARTERDGRARPPSGRGARSAVARRRAVPLAADAHQARRERPRGPHDRRHQPGQRRRQESDGREPRADDGAGVPAARAAHRRRPSPASLFTSCSALPDDPGLTDVLMGGVDVDQALVNVARASPHAAAGGRDPEPSSRTPRLGGDAPRARHAAHPVRSDPHRHAAGRAARRRRTSSRRWRTGC